LNDEEQGMETVRFARYSGETAKIIFAPLFIGLARGYFAEVDVEVEDLDLREQPWETVAAHRADCGAGNVDYCVNPKWAGRMKAVVVHEQFRPGHGLTSLLARGGLVKQGRLTDDPATLRGLTIALPPERGDDFLAYYGALRQGGLTIDDVEIEQTGHTAPKQCYDRGELDGSSATAPRMTSRRGRGWQNAATVPGHPRREDARPGAGIWTSPQPYSRRFSARDRPGSCSRSTIRISWSGATSDWTKSSRTAR
jgi:hypothetical protein